MAGKAHRHLGDFGPLCMVLSHLIKPKTAIESDNPPFIYCPSLSKANEVGSII